MIIAILQRVTSASVTVDKRLVASIGKGILVFAAVGPDDTKKDAETAASRVVKLKMWPDDSNAGWKKSVQDIGGEILCVSQFTLYASTKKGNKPDFHGAAKPGMAKSLYDHFVCKVQELHGQDRVKNGLFQAMMEVGLVNDGPVTLEIDTNPPKRLAADPVSSLAAGLAQQGSEQGTEGVSVSESIQDSSKGLHRGLLE
ncbi:MAG: hypothetical protein Q9227_001312 [Pyrenula ochraceoflavens]